MLSCRDVTRLVASETLEQAGGVRRLAVRLHLLYCRHCRRFVRELKAIADATRRLAAERSPDPARLAELERSILAEQRDRSPEEGPPAG